MIPLCGWPAHIYLVSVLLNRKIISCNLYNWVALPKSNDTTLEILLYVKSNPKKDSKPDTYAQLR